jgi:hypothetical protein
MEHDFSKSVYCSKKYEMMQSAKMSKGGVIGIDVDYSPEGSSGRIDILLTSNEEKATRLPRPVCSHCAS